jgi:hypothetical protein
MAMPRVSMALTVNRLRRHTLVGADVGATRALGARRLMWSIGARCGVVEPG